MDNHHNKHFGGPRSAMTMLLVSVSIIAVFLCASSSSAQLISLHHPETGGNNGHHGLHLPSALRPHRHQSQEPAPAPVVAAPAAVPANPVRVQHRMQPESLAARQPKRFSARPGNVIVHLDRNHDVQSLQYVLHDGHLANLYTRERSHPANAPAPMRVTTRRDQVDVAPPGSVPPATVSAAIPPPPPPPQAQQPTQEQPQSAPTEASSSNHTESAVVSDHTIDILNSKLQNVAHLIGDHQTFEIPIAMNASSDSGPNSGDKIQVLATLAGEAIAAGAHSAGALASRLKTKVGSKLHDLPQIIANKLRAKSSAGQLVLDLARDKVILVDDNTGQVNRLSATAVLQQQPIQQQPQAQPNIRQTSQQQYPLPLQPQMLPQVQMMSNQQLRSE